MANKNKSQGTAWEREVVKFLKDSGYKADRHPLRGVAGEPDAWVHHPSSITPINVVAWKKYSGKGKRRKADKVAVLDWHQFEYLMMMNTEHSFQIQCKATERLNVVDTLNKLKKAVKQIWQHTS